MANRNKVQMSKNLFAKLVDAVEASPDRVLANRDAPRWIKKLSDEDTTLMSQADVMERCLVTRHLILSGAKADSRGIPKARKV